ncbi:putative F-box protein [Cardamine amara subsp. amara]|uniref:F-box protein n=1 Tax=Cardamine amara subsp. amara TaxID=228776 RepID=A0ABD1A093_CARAN
MVSRKLPSELEEEILIQVPRQSLARLRTVCKEWNTLFNDKIFVNKHLACSHPEFVLQTDSNICSISINLNDDPTIQVRCLTFDFLGYHYGNCDGYIFFYDSDKGGVVWNPWLRHITRWIQPVNALSLFSRVLPSKFKL